MENKSEEESMEKEEIEELLQENYRKFKEILKLKDSGQNMEAEISRNKEEWIDLSNQLNESFNLGSQIHDKITQTKWM